MVLRLEWKTLIHEVGGSRPVSGDSAPQIRGLDESATGIGPAKSPAIVGLVPVEVPQSRLAGNLPLYSPGVSAGEMRHRQVHVPVSLREARERPSV